MRVLSRVEHRGARLLLTLSCLIIVIAGLKYASSFLVPIVVALFLSLLCAPPMKRLQRHGIAPWLSLIIVGTGATIVVALFVLVVGRSINQFQASVGEYQARLDQLVQGALTWLQSHGVDVNPETLSKRLNSAEVFELFATVATGLLSALSGMFLIVLTMVFMLLEANQLPWKLRAAKGDPKADLSEFSEAVTRINKYIAIKTWISAGTGVCVSVFTFALGVDFPLLWGLVAFLFNFVPNIGSVIAAVPAVLMALVQFGPGRAGAVAAGYVVINLVIGNAIEPKVMGQRLGLSTLVVFLSLLFWEWIWGPVGMLLSVPLTVVVKILLEHDDDFRWIAVMLGPGRSDQQAD